MAMMWHGRMCFMFLHRLISAQFERPGYIRHLARRSQMKPPGGRVHVPPGGDQITPVDPRQSQLRLSIGG